MISKPIITIVAVFTCYSSMAQKNSSAYSWENLPVIQQTKFKKDTFNIINYGAIGDGTTLNTIAINKAIGDCNSKGGGVVLIPAGLWLTGPIILKSNVDLHLDRAALVQFTKDFDQYPLVEGNWEGKNSVRNQSPISATDQLNIAITGSGVLDGNGDVWRQIGKDRLTENEWKRKVASGGIVSEDGKTWYPSEKNRLGHKMNAADAIKNLKTIKDYEPIKDFLRPNLVVITRCKKVLLQGVTFQNSPAWCLHPLMCEDLSVRNVYVKNPEWAQNGDGIDVESCKNVLIEGSTFECGDDGICVKSGRDEEGRKRGMPTENMIVRNDIVYHAHGGFVIGSEMSGGARNIFVSDCSFIGTDKGLRFKTARGRGGIVENIYCKKIYMKDIVGEAIYFDMYYFTRPPAPGQKVDIPAVNEGTPQFRNFYISDIACDGAEKGIFIRGLPEMGIKNIYLTNVVLKTRRGVEIIEANNISLNNVRTEAGNNFPQVYVENSTNINLDGFKYDKSANVLFSINGDRTSAIHIINTDVSNAKVKSQFNNGATATSLIIN